jgi:hypothetical protein
MVDHLLPFAARPVVAGPTMELPLRTLRGPADRRIGQLTGGPATTWDDSRRQPRHSRGAVRRGPSGRQTRLTAADDVVLLDFGIAIDRCRGPIDGLLKQDSPAAEAYACWLDAAEG